MSGSKNVFPGAGCRRFVVPAQGVSQPPPGDAVHAAVVAHAPRVRPLAACLAVALAAVQANAAAEPAGFTRALLPPRPNATLPVTSCADDGSPGTLRSVVASAATGDTVDMSKLACGTITLLTGQIEVHVDDLTIVGPGRDALAIDGNDSGRVFMHDGAGTLTLTNLTLTHGHVDSAAANPTLALGASGGCVLSKGLAAGTNGSVALLNAAVTSCRATVSALGAGLFSAAGGGIFAFNTLSVSNSILSSNSATGTMSGGGTGLHALGGGAFANKGITLSDSVVSGNSAIAGDITHFAQGGGLMIQAGTVSMTNSVVENNFAGCDTASSFCSVAFGGGVLASDGGTLSLSILSGNTAAASGTAQGGALHSASGLFGATVQISNTTISENRASSANNTGKGGGVYVFHIDQGISNSTISGNSATTGGGVFSDYNTLNVLSSTVSGNSAVKGGGIYLGHHSYYNQTHPMTVRNSTITANVATGSAGGAGIADTHTALGASTFQSTIIAGNIATPADNADLSASLNAIAGANNLIVAAQGVTLPADTISADPLLGPLRDNGGLTLTHALAPQSPAVDAGNNAAKLEHDQRGDGFTRSFGLAPDIGAFERTITPSTCYRRQPPC